MAFEMRYHTIGAHLSSRPTPDRPYAGLGAKTKSPTNFVKITLLCESAFDNSRNELESDLYNTLLLLIIIFLVLLYL